jgi:hypothetical protein
MAPGQPMKVDLVQSDVPFPAFIPHLLELRASAGW